LNLFPRPATVKTMSGEPDNLILVYLRRIDAKVETRLDRIERRLDLIAVPIA